MKGCNVCSDRGWLIYADWSIERCDTCKKFKGDLDAAKAYFKKYGTRTFTLKRIQLVPNHQGRTP